MSLKIYNAQTDELEELTQEKLDQLQIKYQIISKILRCINPSLLKRILSILNNGE